MKYPQALVNIFWYIVLAIELIFLILITSVFFKKGAPKKSLFLFLFDYPIRIRFSVRNTLLILSVILIFAAGIACLIWSDLLVP